MRRTIRRSAGLRDRRATDRAVAALSVLSTLMSVVMVACDRPPGPDRPDAPDATPAGTPGQAAMDSPGVQAGQGADTAAAGTTVTVYFTRGERPVPVERRIAADTADLEAALRELLRGPTAEERQRSITSWFSDATADALRSVAVGADGTVVIDLHDLRDVIPNASTSAGSAMLLGELNATVFGFDHVRAVEYRMDGSCETFWNWLQYDCRIVQRPAG